MESLVELHANIMYYLVVILFSVGWIIGANIRNFENSVQNVITVVNSQPDSLSHIVKHQFILLHPFLENLAKFCVNEQILFDIVYSIIDKADAPFSENEKYSINLCREACVSLLEDVKKAANNIQTLGSRYFSNAESRFLNSYVDLMQKINDSSSLTHNILKRCTTLFERRGKKVEVDFVKKGELFEK